MRIALYIIGAYILFALWMWWEVKQRSAGGRGRKRRGGEMKKRVCPKCGSDELGVNVLVGECRDIHSNVVLSRYETGEHDRPKYTCECGHNFDEAKVLDTDEPDA